MGWTSQTLERVVDLKKGDPKQIEGVFRGSKQIDTQIGRQVIWIFEDDGHSFGVYGFTNLNRELETMARGTLCRVTYMGKQNMKTKFGMKDVHQCQVEVYYPDDEPAAT